MEKQAYIEKYLETASVHGYIFGYSDNGKIFACMVENLTADSLDYLTIEDRGSGSKYGGRYMLKYRQNKDRIRFLNRIASRVLPIASLDEFERLNDETRRKSGRGNRGNLFQTLVAKALNAEEHGAKNADYTMQGDIRLPDGTEYQVKYNKGPIILKKGVEG